jgi:hypothetical protein
MWDNLCTAAGVANRLRSSARTLEVLGLYQAAEDVAEASTTIMVDEDNDGTEGDDDEQYGYRQADG